MVLMYGADVADMFLKAYCEIVPGFQHHPYWDLHAAIGCLPSPRFYEPWRSFGLDYIDQSLLQDRMDDYVSRIVSAL